MKPIVVARRLAVALVLAAILATCAVLGLSRMGIDVLPPRSMRQVHAHFDPLVARGVRAGTSLARKLGSYFHKAAEPRHERNTIVATSPKVQDVVITESFVCQIRSQRHIEVRALEGGYLSKIRIQEGQAVKEGDEMFQILPILYKARLDAETAEAELARLELGYGKMLSDSKVVSPNEVRLLQAKQSRAQAKADLAKAELGFTDVKAPFGGIVDRLLQREGSLIKEGDILTTLADNSVMWVYFNVPEKYYLAYMAARKQREKEDRIDLVLANGDTFPEAGKIGAIEADFNNENGNIKFRADYPNPERLLRHGQTGTIKIRRPLKDALIIPQRATFELLDKLYVWALDHKDVAHQTLITIKHELEDVFVVDKGLRAGDKIVLEGVREVEDGREVEYEFRKPEDVIGNQKFRAE